MIYELKVIKVEISSQKIIRGRVKSLSEFRKKNIDSKPVSAGYKVQTVNGH